MRRVVVTGLGAVTPLGNTISQSWQALIGGKCGIGSLSDEAFAGLPSRVAGQVKGFDHKSHVPKTDLTKTTPFMHFAYAAAHQALEDANWFPEDVKLKQRTVCSPSTSDFRVSSKHAYLLTKGVCIGSGIGCLDEIAETARSFHEKGYKKVSPYFVPKTLVNMAAGNISIRYNFM
ncbi:Mitochondrial beta-keto-acyl synthase, partial [Rhizoclosmatium hyalinum]